MLDFWQVWLYFSFVSYAPQEVPEVGDELVLEEGGDLWGIQVRNQAVDWQIHPHYCFIDLILLPTPGKG